MAKRRTAKKKAASKKAEPNPVAEILAEKVPELTPEQVKAAQAPPTPPQGQQIAPCRKCGGSNYTVQWRKVLVKIGWEATQIHAVAPVPMCSNCYEPNLQMLAEVGDLAGLVPPNQVAPQPTAAQPG